MKTRTRTTSWMAQAGSLAMALAVAFTMVMTTSTQARIESQTPETITIAQEATDAETPTLTAPISTEIAEVAYFGMYRSDIAWAQRWGDASYLLVAHGVISGYTHDGTFTIFQRDAQEIGNYAVGIQSFVRTDQASTAKMDKVAVQIVTDVDTEFAKMISAINATTTQVAQDIDDSALNENSELVDGTILQKTADLAMAIADEEIAGRITEQTTEAADQFAREQSITVYGQIMLTDADTQDATHGLTGEIFPLADDTPTAAYGVQRTIAC